MQMENRINIMNELGEISPIVAQISPALPYQVPNGYFEGLAEQILARIKAEALPPVLEAAKENPYSVPQGYFEKLPELILNRVRAENALNPQEEIEAISPLLSQLRNKQPFNVPVGYFNDLPENITDGAKAIDVVNEELENLSPLMNGLKQKKAYQVPEAYFDGLPEAILEKAKAQQGAKVISIGFTRKLMRYAAAAVVVGIMITGALFFFNTRINGSIDPLAEVENKVTNTNLVTDKALQEYVEYQTSVDMTPTVISNGDDMDESDMKEMLADVTDEEIQAYVEQSGDNDNSLTN